MENQDHDLLPVWTSSQMILIVAGLSFCAFLSPISSTAVLAAVPEIATEFNTTGSTVDLSNAVYIACMAFSVALWGPLSQVFGRRPVTTVISVLFALVSAATALAPSLSAFFIFRALSALLGTAYVLIGAACIGDVYPANQRGTAMSWFMSGTVTGPTLGPLLGGVIVTYSSWRTIFWLQTGLASVAAIGICIFLPETIHSKGALAPRSSSTWIKAKAILRVVNPVRLLGQFRCFNLVLAAYANSALTWNMYSLLTPIRYVINPRYDLDSPLLSGLFYLAPGAGYFLGTFIGGRMSDQTVIRWAKIRNGQRVPEDRLRVTVPFLVFVTPGCLILYGWSLEKGFGGIPLTVITMLVQGVSQMIAFPSINAYCLDAIPGKGADVTSANFFVRYLAGCVGTAAVLPALDGIGVGWFSTITALFVLSSGLGLTGLILSQVRVVSTGGAQRTTCSS